MESCLFLVGAGPGDPDLITLKAIKTLQLADVIIYDALANASLLEYAKPDCIKLFAGKRMGCHYLSQQEINHLIIEYGSRFKNIVRLKGGDPFVFGRAQEEINAGRLAGMSVQIVPGISSCIAAPSSQMIPLTSRGVNESFWVTTGTTRSGAISPDIQLAARSSATVIILMAMSKLEEIMEIFKSEGRSETSVAIIQDATTEKEKMVRGKVKDIFFKALYEELSNPAVIIVGEVVDLNSSLSHVTSTSVLNETA